jgi:hypothetical protein
MNNPTRNPTEFLRRQGLVTDPIRPSPRLDLHSLLVHTIPLQSPPHPGATVLREYEGDTPPDRAGSRPWPDQGEGEQ